MNPEPLIRIRDLDVAFNGTAGPVRVLRGVSASLPRGRIVGVVGESGSGKSTLAAAIMGLLPPNLAQLSGEILFGDRNLLALPRSELKALRGTRFAMIFQDPMTALNPVFTVGTQLVDMQRARHPSTARRILQGRAAEMLARVGIPDASKRLDQYPHQFSGGMRQRVMIAAALLCEPDLLIADEPTTALDPTIETQIVHLLSDLRRDFGGTIVLISHSLGLIAELCDEVVVMYAGTVVEAAPTASLFAEQRHPYTRALLACEVGGDVRRGDRLATIAGDVPDLARLPAGCVFASRCPRVLERCTAHVPPLEAHGASLAACLRADEVLP